MQPVTGQRSMTIKVRCWQVRSHKSGSSRTSSSKTHDMCNHTVASCGVLAPCHFPCDITPWNAFSNSQAQRAMLSNVVGTVRLQSHQSFWLVLTRKSRTYYAGALARNSWEKTSDWNPSHKLRSRANSTSRLLFTCGAKEEAQLATFLRVSRWPLKHWPGTLVLCVKS